VQPDCSVDNNILPLVNKYMDAYLLDEKNLSYHIGKSGAGNTSIIMAILTVASLWVDFWIGFYVAVTIVALISAAYLFFSATGMNL